LKDAIHKRNNDEILRLLCEIRAKGGLPAERVDLILKQMNMET
jgi:hypothetical protein